ncbi:oxygen-independent coproporphyrinogen III oxidase [Chitinophaga lutea]
MSFLSQYNIPAPRYTSYPTVPFWNNKPGNASLMQGATEPLSLYIHLPFCEKLCTYCGCNKYITVNHGHEQPYIASVLQEWALHRRRFAGRPRLAELHLGGGTPTFFSPYNLRLLLEGILQDCDVLPDACFSFEGHPGNTTYDHLLTLYDLGFRRMSLGIQDFDPNVQHIINRPQPFEQVYRAVRDARRIGYTSINFDLIYGLPLQTVESVENTIQQCMQLLPERISFYSYAHVPWIKGNGQRLFSEKDLPKDAEKRRLYETGKALMEQFHYAEVGMDHFALPDDELFAAARNGTLHRNFMGYTIARSTRLIGLGVSAISDHYYTYTQNEKQLAEYQRRVAAGELPVMRSHLLDMEDIHRRRLIQDLMCQFRTTAEVPADAMEKLRQPMADGLVVTEGGGLRVTQKGRPYIRNICMAFDTYLPEQRPEEKLFSASI